MLGSFENLFLKYINQRGVKELSMPFWIFCLYLFVVFFFFISYHKSPSILPPETKRNSFHHFNTEAYLYCHGIKANLLKTRALLSKSLNQNTQGCQFGTFSYSGTTLDLPVVKGSFVLLQLPVRPRTDH